MTGEQTISNNMIYEFLKEFKRDVNKRFEQVDKRFEQVDKRFEHIETRQGEDHKMLIELWERKHKIDELWQRKDKIDQLAAQQYKIDELWQSKGKLKITYSRQLLGVNALLAGLTALTISIFFNLIIK